MANAGLLVEIFSKCCECSNEQLIKLELNKWSLSITQRLRLWQGSCFWCARCFGCCYVTEDRWETQIANNLTSKSKENVVNVSAGC